MPIPRINNGDTLKDVRELSLNPLINVVNEHEIELGEKSILIAQNTAATLGNKDSIAANTAAINKLMDDVVSAGVKYIVDNRSFTYSTTGSFCTIDAELSSDEYPVRAVIRSFDTSTKKGTFIPCSGIQFDRNIGVIIADVGSVKSGTIYVEFWKEVKP